MTLPVGGTTPRRAVHGAAETANGGDNRWQTAALGRALIEVPAEHGADTGVMAWEYLLVVAQADARDT